MPQIWQEWGSAIAELGQHPPDWVTPAHARLLKHTSARTSNTNTNPLKLAHMSSVEARIAGAVRVRWLTRMPRCDGTAGGSGGAHAQLPCPSAASRPRLHRSRIERSLHAASRDSGTVRSR